MDFNFLELGALPWVCLKGCNSNVSWNTSPVVAPSPDYRDCFNDMATLSLVSSFSGPGTLYSDSDVLRTQSPEDTRIAKVSFCTNSSGELTEFQFSTCKSTQT